MLSASKIAKCAVLMMVGSLMVAQENPGTKAKNPHPLTATDVGHGKKTTSKGDPQIVAAMKKVSAEQLKANDEAGFIRNAADTVGEITGRFSAGNQEGGPMDPGAIRELFESL